MAGRDRAGQCDLLAPLGVHRVSIFLMIYAPMALFPSDRPERRTEPRRPANVAGVVVGPGLELGCTIVDVSDQGMRIRLSRNLALPDEVIVVEVGAGLAHEGRVVRRQGVEAGLKRLRQTRLGGLVPARLTAAREAWLRAGGR